LLKPKEILSEIKSIIKDSGQKRNNQRLLTFKDWSAIINMDKPGRGFARKIILIGTKWLL